MQVLISIWTFHTDWSLLAFGESYYVSICPVLAWSAHCEQLVQAGLCWRVNSDNTLTAVCWQEHWHKADWYHELAILPTCTQPVHCIFHYVVNYNKKLSLTLLVLSNISDGCCSSRDACNTLLRQWLCCSNSYSLQLQAIQACYNITTHLVQLSCDYQSALRLVWYTLAWKILTNTTDRALDPVHSNNVARVLSMYRALAEQCIYPGKQAVHSIKKAWI